MELVSPFVSQSRVALASQAASSSTACANASSAICSLTLFSEGSSVGFNGKLDQFPLDSKLSSDNTLGLRMLPPRIFGRLYQHLGCIWECVHSYLSIIYKLNAVFWCRRFTMVYRGDDGGLVVVSRV